MDGCNSLFAAMNVTLVNPLCDHLCQLQPLWERRQVLFDRGKIHPAVEARLCCSVNELWGATSHDEIIGGKVLL